jgi:hypothetical protein
MNQMTSPALALAISSFNPDWLVRPARTKRSASQILACSSAALGSASMILAVSRVSNLPHGNPTIEGATAASTCIAESRLRCRVAWATFRARHDATWPVRMSRHSSGSRCRRSNASAITARADPTVVSIRAPSSAAANSNTCGVPCPPSCLACSAPGNGFPVDGGWLSGWLRSAQCAANSTNTHSCSRTWRWAWPTSDKVAAASGPPWLSNTHSY